MQKGEHEAKCMQVRKNLHQVDSLGMHFQKHVFVFALVIWIDYSGTCNKLNIAENQWKDLLNFSLRYFQ